MSQKERNSIQASTLHNIERRELEQLVTTIQCQPPFDYLLQVTDTTFNDNIMLPSFKEVRDLRETILATLQNTYKEQTTAVFAITGQLGAGKTTTLKRIYDTCQREGLNIGIVTAEDAIDIGRRMILETPQGQTYAIDPNHTAGPYTETEYKNASRIQSLAQKVAIQEHSVVLIENPVITDFQKVSTEQGTSFIVPTMDRGTSAYRDLIKRQDEYAELSYLTVTFGIIEGKHHRRNKTLPSQGLYPLPGGTFASTLSAETRQHKYLEQVEAVNHIFPHPNEKPIVDGLLRVYPYRVLGDIASYKSIFVDYLQKENSDNVSLYVNDGIPSTPVTDEERQETGRIFYENSVIKRLEREGRTDELVPQSF